MGRRDLMKRIEEAITRDECNNISVKAAKKYREKRRKQLEKQREKYKRELCKQIKCAAKEGRFNTSTLSLHEADFMDSLFLVELKEYFEERGFDVRKVDKSYGFLDTWLTISWE